ncbi:MAG: hypothetical protein R2731_11530 [Nocardioides sp.]
MRTLAAVASSALLAGGLAGVLTGCGATTDGAGSDAASSSTSPSVAVSTPADDPSDGASETAAPKPAAGPELSARGFTFRVPKGWADVTADAPAGVLASGVNLTEDDVPDMVVVRAVTAKASFDALAKAASADLAAHGARRISQPEPAAAAAPGLARQRAHRRHRGARPAPAVRRRRGRQGLRDHVLHQQVEDRRAAAGDDRRHPRDVALELTCRVRCGTPPAADGR